MKQIIFFLFLCSFFTNLKADERNLLQQSLSKDQLAAYLSKGTDWVYFPAYTDREAWNKLPAPIRSQAISSGEKALSFEWGIIKATDYLEFTRSGNRSIMQDPATAREKALQDLALAELIEGKGRFIDALVNGVWAICEQSTWVLSAHLPNLKEGAGLPNPKNVTIDLGSARTAALLAWIHYYFAPSFNQVSPYIANRIQSEIDYRILQPYYTRSDMWWMGFGGGMVNNWNVWVNYNVMQCIMLIEKKQQNRVTYMHKALQSIDQFINYYPDDGGCEEGPTYWGHAGGKLFECLELLEAVSQQKINIYSHPVVKNIGTYIYKAYIADPYFVNFADASAKGAPPAGLIYRYGQAIGDIHLQNLGSYYAHKAQLDQFIPSGTLETQIHDLFDTQTLLQNKSNPTFEAAYWLPQTQLAVARNQANSTNGFFFAAKGGYNNESHNHNDVGTFILYYNGNPALIDVGVGTYTRKTFSADRYSIWTMQSGYHNVPLINGVEQAFGSKYKAKNVSFTSSNKRTQLTLDLADAYPAEAEIAHWIRSYQLSKNNQFSINDAYQLKVNKGQSALHFITCCKIDTTEAGVLHLIGSNFRLKMPYNLNKLRVEIDPIAVDDKRLQLAWGTSLTRIRLVFKDTGLSGSNSIQITAY